MSAGPAAAFFFVFAFLPTILFGSLTPFLFPGALAGLLVWGCWYWELASAAPLGAKRRERRLLQWAPAASLVLSTIVVIARGEIFLPSVGLAKHLMMWFFWVTSMTLSIPYFGLIARDDVAERDNKAAALAIAGAIVAFAFCSALAGHRALVAGLEREVIWEASGAFGLLLIVWYVVETKTHLSETITIERDASAGWRLAGVLLAAALLLGPGADALVVRDWWIGAIEISGVVLLAVAAVAVERIVQPLRSFRQPVGIGLAFAYVLFAGLVAYVGG